VAISSSSYLPALTTTCLREALVGATPAFREDFIMVAIAAVV
jgi:hypothetical protein